MKDNRELYEEQIDSNKSKRFWSIVLGFLGTAGIFTGALFLRGILPQLFLPALALGAGAPIASVFQSQLAKIHKKAAEKKLDHLDRVHKQGIAKSDALDQARVKKIEELEKAIGKEDADMDANSWITAAGAAVWIVCTAAGAVFQPALFGSLAGLMFMGASTDDILEHEAKKSELETRVENIKNDLVLEHTYGYPAKGTSTRVATKDVATNAKAKAIPNPSYEAQVDAYIKGLESSKEIEKPFEKVK